MNQSTLTQNIPGLVKMSSMTHLQFQSKRIAVNFSFMLICVLNVKLSPYLRRKTVQRENIEAHKINRGNGQEDSNRDI